jgi:Cu2+-exporting ATPase
MATACLHCSLPVPPGFVTSGGASSFCCNGCETAYAIINSCGLERYYAVREAAQAQSVPAKVTRRAYAEFDDNTFQSMYCKPLPGGLLNIDLLLEGVHCAACVWLVEKLSRIAPGVIETRLDIRRASVNVTFDPTKIPLSRVARALDTLGYPPHPARGVESRKFRSAEDRRMLVRMAVAGACAGNIMLLFFALYAGMFEGMDRAHEQLFRWIAMGLNTLALAWPGWVFGRSAIAAIRTRTIHLDVPIALGLYLGGIWGAWKTVAGHGDIYFDSISALVFFLLVGRYVQQRQQRYAADAVELLFSLAPTIAHRVEADGSIADIPTEALQIGDTVEVRAGDSVPADGVILTGSSSVDLSMLTGESRPVRLQPSDAVAAGTTNLTAPLRMQVLATGEATRIGKLLRTIEEASRRRAAIVRLADQWGRRLLWALLALSAITLAIWWHLGPAIALDRAVALLIATCPCGLGLATPMAMTIALGRAARRGILIKGGDALQSLASPGTIVLDKTGTVTLGRLGLVRWWGDRNAMSPLSALEQLSSHPAAIALVRDLGQSTISTRSVTHVVQHAGAGISGTVGDHRMIAGTQSFLTREGVTLANEQLAWVDEALSEDLSPICVSIDGRCVAIAGMGDPVRPDAAASITQLRSRGWHVHMLSGDHPELALAVGREIGLSPGDCTGGASPEDKLARIRELGLRGPVVMVGDGVNDAAALAAATVGIAIRGGAEASITAADVSLSGEGLTPIIELLDGARASMRTIKWTIVSSLAYNVLAASLSMAGLISPLLAAFIMPASSLTVVAICLGGPAFRQPRVLARQTDPAPSPLPNATPIGEAA